MGGRTRCAKVYGLTDSIVDEGALAVALSIHTNTAALSAYQSLSTQAVQREQAATAVPAAAPVDTVQIAHVNAEAAASSVTIDDAAMATQITQLAAAQIGANAMAALAAQANSSPDSVLALLQ